jgi:hypothetical protein
LRGWLVFAGALHPLGVAHTDAVYRINKLANFEVAMLETVQHYAQLSVPLWLVAWIVAVLWFRDRQTRKWIARIAATVDKMDSDENGWCRHDPVSSTEDPARGLLEQLTRGKKA